MARIGAVQAQDYNAALWAVGLRCRGSTIGDIEKAIALGKIIRTWPLRQTLHFVSPRDVRWMLGFYPERKIPRYQRDNGLTDRSLVVGLGLVAKAFRKREFLSYSEMHKALEGTGVPELDKTEVQSHVIRRAGRMGIICFGPHRGKSPTFTLLDNWVPRAAQMDKRRALGELALRYFSSHGPATIQDYVWWSGLRVSEAAAGIEASVQKLRKEIFDGKTYYMRGRGASRSDSDAHLLPAFDEYLVGYKDRAAMLSNEKTQKMLRSGKIFFTHSNGIFLPTIVISGQVLGTWKCRHGKDKSVVSVTPFVRFGAVERSLVREAAQRYGEFIGKGIDVKV
ncbi:MAG: AlkZ family DNA glycosylase [Candidatus Micrarchaeota archaeon]|nr:AlkZ family DNA glycosylase [Candidatus Micrarchaeota archaeon]